MAWRFHLVASILLALGGVASASVDPVDLVRLVRFSERVVLGRVEKVHEIAAPRDDEEPTRIRVAEVRVLRRLAGSGTQDRLFFLATSTWACDVSTAVAGEIALLFLDPLTIDELCEPGIVAAVRTRSFRDALARITGGRRLLALGWAGCGRMPVYDVGGGEYVNLPADRTSLLSSLATIPGPDPCYRWRRSVPLNRVLALVSELGRPPDSKILAEFLSTTPARRLEILDGEVPERPELIALGLLDQDSNVLLKTHDLVYDVVGELPAERLLAAAAHPHPLVREASTRLLLELTEEQLVRALRADARRIRRAAARAFSLRARHRDPVPVTALTMALADPDDEVRRISAHALGVLVEKSDEVAAPGLLMALRDPDPNVRRVACEGLGSASGRDRLGGRADAAERGVRRALGDGDVTVRRAAAEALGTIASRASETALVAATKDPDLVVRGNAWAALGAAAGEASVPRLSEALSDEDAWIRRCAVLGLRRAGGDAAAKALEGAGKDPDQGVRRAVRRALQGLRKD